MSNINSKYNCGVVILAAGESSRMGMPKPFLIYDDSQVFIENIIHVYLNFSVNNIVVVINPKHHWQVFKNEFINDERITFIENQHLEFERFYSVKLGLSKFKDIDYCFIQNTDNPFIDKSILNKIYLNRSKDEYIVPVFNNKGGHPVLLNKKAINQILTHNDNFANLKEVLKPVERIDLIMTDDRVLININDYDEYLKYFEKYLNNAV